MSQNDVFPRVLVHANDDFRSMRSAMRKSAPGRRVGIVGGRKMQEDPIGDYVNEGRVRRWQRTSGTESALLCRNQ